MAKKKSTRRSDKLIDIGPLIEVKSRAQRQYESKWECAEAIRQAEFSLNNLSDKVRYAWMEAHDNLTFNLNHRIAAEELCAHLMRLKDEMKALLTALAVLFPMPPARRVKKTTKKTSKRRR